MQGIGAGEEVCKSLKQLIEPPLLVSMGQANCCTPGEVSVSMAGEGLSIISSNTAFQRCQPALGALHHQPCRVMSHSVPGVCWHKEV